MTKFEQYEKIDLICRSFSSKYRILFHKTLEIFEQHSMNEFPEHGIFIFQLQRKLDVKLYDIKIILHFLLYLGIIEGQDPMLIEYDYLTPQYTFVGY